LEMQGQARYDTTSISKIARVFLYLSRNHRYSHVSTRKKMFGGLSCSQ